MVQLVEILYIVFSITLTIAGLSMVWMGVRAYKRTEREDMIHLSVGFMLIVGAAIGTTISAFLTNFEESRSLLTVNYLITTVGFLFVMYSLTPNE